jgi:hypothetical protein
VRSCLRRPTRGEAPVDVLSFRFIPARKGIYTSKTKFVITQGDSDRLFCNRSVLVLEDHNLPLTSFGATAKVYISQAPMLLPRTITWADDSGETGIGPHGN